MLYGNAHGYQVTRHVCPHNCYDTCGILAYVHNGKLVKITGDPEHGYTGGKLCAKGLTYLQRVYSPQRIKYPMRQLGRGSGNWQYISWDQALEIIAAKILEIKDYYGSTLPLCLNKYSGNFGILHYATEGLFNSLGPTTQVLGSPCWSAGLDAQYLDMGGNCNSEPGEMENAQLIVIWGANPAWTAVHSLPYIYRAQEKGARVIVIDPVFSQTAKKADWYIQIRPGEDSTLALLLAKVIVELGKEDREFLANYTEGWPRFKQCLAEYDLEQGGKQCGIKPAVIKELAQMLVESRPVFFWVGYGLQRHINGGQAIRAIDALGALTGNIGRKGGGVHYANLKIWNLFKYNFLQTQAANRYLNINEFARGLKKAQDPPVKMLWVSCRNLFQQDADLPGLLEQLEEIDLIVTVDQFINETAANSDLFLPATTFFEEIDLVPGYWHHWLGINEQAISPYFEAKSDLEIARLTARKLNQLRPGTSTFPQEKEAEELLDDELDESAYRLLGISHWTELKTAPVRVNIPVTAWEDKKFSTPSGKFEFCAPVLAKGLRPGKKYPFWLLTPHSLFSLNSQFYNIGWLKVYKKEPHVLINPLAAREKKLKSGDLIRIYNDQGEITITAIISGETQRDIILCYPGTFSRQVKINTLIKDTPTDLGDITTGTKGLAFYDVFVDFEVVD